MTTTKKNNEKGTSVLSLIIVCVFFYALIFQRNEKIEYRESDYRKLEVAQSKKYLLKDATIITMKNEKDVFHGSILVSNGIITFIGQDKQINYPKGIEIIDCTDKYILPGHADIMFMRMSYKPIKGFWPTGLPL